MTTTHSDLAPAVVPDEATATQVYRIVIKAPAQRIWEAITTPEYSRRYFHGAAITATPERMTSYGPDGSTWGDSEVLEWDPPRRLAYGWRSAYDDVAGAEPESRVTWEIEGLSDGTCLVTLIHDRLEDAPVTRAGVAGRGWMGVLSAMKTLLETGEPMHEDYTG